MGTYTARLISRAACVRFASLFVTEMPITDGRCALDTPPQPPLKKPLTCIEEKPTMDATYPFPTSGIMHMSGSG